MNCFRTNKERKMKRKIESVQEQRAELAGRIIANKASSNEVNSELVAMHGADSREVKARALILSELLELDLSDMADVESFIREYFTVESDEIDVNYGHAMASGFADEMIN